MNRPVMAGRRDASAYNQPNTYSPKKAHIAGHGWRAGCDSRIILQQRLVEAERIPAASRCRRLGCVNKWPEAAG
jgi:hypothetical protein